MDKVYGTKGRTRKRTWDTRMRYLWEVNTRSIVGKAAKILLRGGCRGERGRR